MDNSVIIKGNHHGITVVLDANTEYSELKEKVAEKFKDSSKFLGAAQVVLGFEGRALLPEQEKELLDIITANCELNVVCLMDNDEEKDKLFEKSLNEKLMDLAANSGTFYKGNLRSGQAMTFESSVVILGDINPGASVTSTGNIIVLGALKGQAYAGAGGNQNAFVFAIDMSPVMIRIADFLARSSDDHGKNESNGMQIAYLDDGNIVLEPLNKKVWNEIKF